MGSTIATPPAIRMKAIVQDAHVVLHRKTRADLEQSLAVSGAEFIEDRPPRGICQCLEDVTQTVTMIGKQSLACQGPFRPAQWG
jgi:hypothetical protein